jgi:hypothetical protein
MFDKNDCIPYCKGSGAKYTEAEMVPILFKSFPTKWKDDYTENPSNDLSTTTIDSIMTFMKQKEAVAVLKQAQNKIKQANESKDQQ